MYNLSLDEILTIIQKKTGQDRTEVMLKIQKKVEELSGLISMEGAAHMVANESGIELVDNTDKFFKIKDVIPGLRSISFSGIVKRVFPVYSFDKGGRKGKVASLTLSDGTGEIRLVMWNHRVELVEKSTIKEGDIVRVHNVFAKEGKYGIEVHMRDKSKLELNPPDVKHSLKSSSSESIKISKIEPNIEVNISGSLIDLYSKAFVFRSCPECKKKLEYGDVCKEHGKVEPKHSFILNLIIDDGTAAVRCVLFGNQVEKFLKKSKDELLEMVNTNKDPILLSKPKLIGVEVSISGKARISSFDNKLEIIVSSSDFIDAKQEARRILKDFKE